MFVPFKTAAIWTNTQIPPNEENSAAAASGSRNRCSPISLHPLLTSIIPQIAAQIHWPLRSYTPCLNLRNKIYSICEISYCPEKNDIPQQYDIAEISKNVWKSKTINKYYSPRPKNLLLYRQIFSLWPGNFWHKKFAVFGKTANPIANLTKSPKKAI